jgi:4,5-DOPA dioxygenase extradiol
MSALPALFLSHGAPTMAVEDSPAARFLDGLAAQLPRPRAILIASAHFEAAVPTLMANPAPTTTHDFGGFPDHLYTLRYPAAGSPELAERAASLLRAAGFTPELDRQRGFDHGIWTPLMRVYPRADIPVVGLSVNPRADARWHYSVGRAVSELRNEGVLIIGSGSYSHNLGALSWQAAAADSPWMTAFASWMRERLLAGDVDSVLDWQKQAPHARQNHPSDEHLLPLFVALGAGGDPPSTRVLHRSTQLGALAMDAFAFGSSQIA